ncbi:MAG: malto-oligosyltrehalose trehalohydrolase [Burkholderiales bacterium]|nr:malto-oligosyltrehalose trehalohydrolase [Burkholderiales bacterium]
MARIGHHRDAQGRSHFRVFAPGKRSVAVVLTQSGRTLPLAGGEADDGPGYWCGQAEALPAGTLYQIEVDGRRLPDPASRSQPQGVHGPSMIVDAERAGPAGWRGVRIEDAILYELHVGTFTAEGTLAAATQRLAHLSELGVTVIELLPLAAFPGERNWGYDGTYPYALHAAYGELGDLRAFIEAAHARGLAVILDVVYNHFGPEGNYSGAFAPYTKRAPTPWGDAINFDGPYNHGVREFFLENARFWLAEVGFDGLRMDAVSLIFDNMPRHILCEFTDLGRRIGREQGREILMIAEHLRNNRHVTEAAGFGYHAQWNDDLNHAIYALLTGERHHHYGNFGAFGDVRKALEEGFVLDGTRFDRVHRYYLGTDGRDLPATAHVVHIQNHDQVGNRLRGDRLIASYGRERALLAITAVMASPYVPMLFMGEEYGETAPFLFHEDFSDPVVIRGVREGRQADFAFGGVEPPDPHARSSFEASKLQWGRKDEPQGQAVLRYYRELIALKRSGELGPRERRQVEIRAEAPRQLLFVQTPHTLTALNFSGEAQAWDAPAGWEPCLASAAEAVPGRLPPFGAVVLRRSPR